jgi:hypothetical protein
LSTTDLNSIISYLPDLLVPETPSGFHKLVWGLLILSVLTIFSFIDITAHLLAIVNLTNYSGVLDK